MIRIIATLALLAALAGCGRYTERTSPCVCAWEPANAEVRLDGILA